MTSMEILADIIIRNGGLLAATIGDFTDADMFLRPFPNANHAAWQVGHILAFEAMAYGLLMPPDKLPAPPAGLEPQKYNRETAGIDDPSRFVSRGTLLEYLPRLRQAEATWVRTLTDADLAKPAPERFTRFAPTVGHLVINQAHLMMHLGQIQVIRRKLGKAVLM